MRLYDCDSHKIAEDLIEKTRNSYRFRFSINSQRKLEMLLWLILCLSALVIDNASILNDDNKNHNFTSRCRKFHHSTLFHNISFFFNIF
uniref:Uncharacterized protein n=1 Tax=Trichobilharzia regenti TaxID=157069 RepID=A0AA85KCA9_TRIRE|nr:unnamed protein product [Trichobilharzia regenti]